LTVLSSKFSRDKEALSHVAVMRPEIGELVKPIKKISIFKDDPNNRILECGIHGKIYLLATGDKEMFQLRAYKGIKTMSLKEYIES